MKIRKVSPRHLAGLTARFRPRRSVGVVTVAAVALVVAGVALAGAVSTTDNAGFVNTFTDGTTTTTYTNQACLNGHGVNCNIYLDKRDVWLSGLPESAALSAGTYFFAVVVPGGQPDPNDAGTKNLSDTFVSPYDTGDTNADGSGIPSGDLWTNREFTVDGDGHITAYSGTHQRSGDKLQVFPYDDTKNNGGVYILAVCKVPSGAGTTTGAGTPGVNPRDCKYDAFKVRPAGGTTPATDLTVTKGVDPSFTRLFKWSIVKSVDACQVTAQNTTGCSITSGTTKTLNYTVTVTKDDGTDSDWQASGDITIFNPNDKDATSVVVTDAISGPSSANCLVDAGDTVSTDGVVGTLASGASLTLPYVCTFSAKPTYNTDYTNTATVSWDKDSVGTTNSSADFPLKFQFTTPTTVIHNSVTVSDLITSTIPAVLPPGFVVGSAIPTGNPVSDPVGGTLTDDKTFTYSRTLTVPHDCLTVNNTASFLVTDPEDPADADDSGSSSVSVKVCRTPALTGALTMGFWQNKNGQGIIQNYSGASCASLKTFLTTFNPFKDLSATICGTSPSLVKNASPSGVVGYVYNIIKVATCTSSSNTCNTMLRAQMLATALDVYFSASSISLGSTAYPGGALALTLGGNRIGAPAAIAAAGGVGAVSIDLTQICGMIDGSGGTATCSGTYRSVANEFGGNNSLKVIEMLYYMNADGSAFNNGNPVATATTGASWYLQNKAKQVNAKDAFDAINNAVAFAI